MRPATVALDRESPQAVNPTAMSTTPHWYRKAAGEYVLVVAGHVPENCCGVIDCHSHDNQIPLQYAGRDEQRAVSDKAVHFAAHAEFSGNVDTGLNRETHTGNQQSIVA